VIEGNFLRRKLNEKTTGYNGISNRLSRVFAPM
jgi:hypothetical protein